MGRLSESLRFIWVLWFFLLVSTPYSLEDQARPLYLSSSYAYVSFGIIIGVLIGLVVARCLSKEALSFSVSIVCFAGGLLSLFLVFAEWASFIARVNEGLSPMFLSVFEECFSGYPSVHHALLIMAGLMMGAAASCFIVRSGHYERTGAEGRFDLLFVLPMVCLGFCHSVYYQVGDLIGLGYGDGACIASFLYACVSFMILMIARCGNGGFLSLQCMVAFCGGQIAWNLIARCSSTVMISEFLLWVLCALLLTSFLVLLGGVAIAKWPDSKVDKEADTAEGDRKIAGSIILEDAEAVELQRRFNLTDRECEAVWLMLQGATSRESAEMMGVKAPTVRNYLQRAYAKASVSSSGELKALLYPTEPVLHASEILPGKDVSRNRGWSLVAIVFILATSLGCLLLPNDEGRAIEHSVILGIGLGLFLSGGLWLTKCLSSEDGGKIKIPRKLTKVLIVALAFLFCASLTSCALLNWAMSCSAVCASACLLVCALAVLCRAPGGGFALDGASVAGQYDVALGIVAAVLLPGYALGYLCERPSDAFSTVLLVASLLVLAFFVIVCFKNGGRSFLKDAECLIAFGVGFGLILGCVTADRFIEYLCVIANEPMQPGVFTPLISTSVVSSFVAMVSLTGAAYLAFVCRFSYCPELPERSHGRVVHYLLARGLSEQESEVVALIAEGFTGSQIAVKMHYSLGSVNAMRLAGYRILGIHAKSELDFLLKEIVGIDK